MLYIVALSWFVLPIYGGALGLVLPSATPIFDRSLDVALVAMGPAALWWGIQGGPLFVSRAAVVHELGSPASRVALLLPRLVRTAMTGATFAAVGGAVLLAINGGAADGVAAPAVVSGVCAFGVATAVFQAATWHVVVHAHEAPRLGLGLASAAPLLGGLTLVFADGSASSARGVGILAVVALVSGAVAAVAVRWTPVEGLWRRAAGLAAIRSALQTFDFQRVFLDLRRVSSRAQPGRVRLARAWMPLALWRQLAGLQQGAVRQAVHLGAVMLALAAIVRFADLDQGLVLLAAASLAGWLGLELSGALAATADQAAFVVHYPRGSASVLRRQLLTMLLLSLAAGALAVGWQSIISPGEALVVLLLCGYGALGAALQARLGSPNIGAYLDILGFDAVGPLLWARAMIGPAVLFVGAVALFHGLLHATPQSARAWAVVAMAAAALAVVVTTWSLEAKRE